MLMSTRSPLAELNVLKKICDHPRLLSTLACEQLGLDEEARFVAQFCNPYEAIIKAVILVYLQQTILFCKLYSTTNAGKFHYRLDFDWY